MSGDKLYYLAKVQLLSELTTQDLSELAEDFSWAELPTGTDILKQGENSKAFYVLAEGITQSLIAKPGNSAWRVHTFSPGDIFGEISLFTEQPSPTTVQAQGPCKVLVMDADHFAHMLARWPKLYPKFIEKLSHNLTQVNQGLWEAKHKDFLLSTLVQNQFEYKFYGIWGGPKTTRETETKLTELAQNGGHLFLIGERGTGRQMFAWYLHRRRFSESAPFVVVDGHQFDQQWGDMVLESSDPDPSTVKSPTLLDVVNKGTLLIRDIDHISPRSQLKLAQALEHRKANCLVIASLEKEPEQLGNKVIPELKKCFTQTYAITPLRERKRDIPFLAQGILEKLAKQHNLPVPTLDQEATKLILSHSYRQGNVSELIQVVERSFFLAENNVIGLEHVFFGPTAAKIGRSIDLMQWNWIEKLIKNGSFVLWLQRICTGIFGTIILFLLFGPKIAVATGVFAAVWGLWWPALAIISPSLGRVWCTVCPFAFVMELVQKHLHLNRQVPDLLKKYDYLIITFLFQLILWVEAVGGLRSSPRSTGVLLLTIQTLALLTGIIFTRHTWCRHLCPLGGFVGVASIGGMLEVRSDSTVCVNKCTTHECYKGTPAISGCPMSQHAQFLDNNLGCKLCFHCARNCPHGAIKVNVRVPAREVWHLVRVDQGFAVFIGTALAILFPINYFEPLHQVWPSHTWTLWFSIFYWGSGIVGGALTWLIARPFKTKAASPRIKYVFAFIPLVLSGYIIYQLHFIPGLNSLLLGFGFKNLSGNIQTTLVPAFTVGAVLATLIGTILTGFTVLMVFLRNRNKISPRTGKQS